MKHTQILVTGGSGFIGSNFIRHVISERSEWSIINLDALTYSGNRMNLAKIEAAGGTCYRFVHGDIRNVGFLEKLFAEHRFDGVFHFAAESPVDRSIVGPEVFAETNVLGTFRLFDNSSQQPLFQDLTDISGTVDNAKDKNIRFGNLVNDPEFILDDLPVFKVRDSQ